MTEADGCEQLVQVVTKPSTDRESSLRSRDRNGATENAGVEIAGVDRTGGKCRSKSYGTPNRDYFERILSYLNLVRWTRYRLVHGA